MGEVVAFRRPEGEFPPPLMPEYTFQRDREFILKRIAKFIAEYGYCPTVETLFRKARKLKTDERVVREHLRLAIQDGLLKRDGRWYFNLTEAGWAAIRTKPITPDLPSHPKARRKQKSILMQMRDLERKKRELGLESE